MDARDDKTQPDRQFTDLLDGMDVLADAIDHRAYPGRAWPLRRPVRRLVLRVLAGAAAAAVIVIGVVLWSNKPHRDTQRLESTPQITQVASRPVQSQPLWCVPYEVDPSISGHVTLEIPSITMPPEGEPGGLWWNIPTISSPFSPEWSNAS
ncbi:MAG: hypothetical protein QF577_05505 [Phycisphaerae bacterium]|jgi:hypothetical protein|nr:hypothetical protein [Phycisphaerae bacterium]